MSFPHILNIILATSWFIFFQTEAVYAGSSSTVVSDVPSEIVPNPSLPGNSQAASGLSTLPLNNSVPSINQQADFIQNNSSGFSNLTYPNCQGACVFAIGRTNSRQSWEAVAGVVWQISSPENTQAETHRLTAQSERDRFDRESTVILVEKLSDAIESGKIERANLLAIILAKRLGYGDYQKLLREARGK